ncbi:MAG: toxin-antitoxin system YwqK family antitoxin [Planctomycetota bacterium]
MTCPAQSALNNRLALAVATVLFVCGITCTSSFAQGDAGDSVTIKPYTGEPVFLDMGEAPPEPRIVSQREKTTEKYPDGTPRFEREVAKYSDNSFVNNGFYREYYQSGELFVDGAFELGVRTGDWTYYHENGEVAKKLSFVDGEPDGSVEVRRADGTLEAKREYAAGKRVGTWMIYGETGEQLIREENYVDGLPEGVWKQWYPSGQLWRETTFKAGKRDGKAREWNADGTPRAEAEFVAGVREGVTTEWNAAGEKIERRYKDGKLQFEPSS